MGVKYAGALATLLHGSVLIEWLQINTAYCYTRFPYSVLQFP